MVPVAVSVPDTIDIEISMNTENWAFGKVIGTPRQ
jgi:hypothetical protein